MDYQLLYAEEKVGTVEAGRLFEKLETLEKDLTEAGFTCETTKYANGEKLTVSFNGEEICDYSVTCDRWTTSMHITDLIAFRKVQEAAA